MYLATITAIILISANIHTIVHTMTAAPYAYFNTVWAGSEDPVWPHLILVPLSAIAGIAVGAGILMDRPKFSDDTRAFAIWFLIIGVPIESLCTILLFLVDERISVAQTALLNAAQSALNVTTERLRITELHAPDRRLEFADRVYFQDIAGVSFGQRLSIRFPEGDHEAHAFADSIGDMLQGMFGWKPIVSPFCEAPLIENPANGPHRKCPIGPLPPGIWGPFGGDPKNWREEAAKSNLLLALHSAGFCIRHVEWTDLKDSAPDVITLVIGAKNVTAPDCK